MNKDIFRPLSFTSYQEYISVCVSGSIGLSTIFHFGLIMANISLTELGAVTSTINSTIHFFRENILLKMGSSAKDVNCECHISRMHL